MKTLKRTILFISILILTQSNIFSIEMDSAEIMIDTVEYELIVFDPGFEVYLISQPPMEYYTKNYYKSWNIRYVSEWNHRHINQASTGL